MSKKVKNMAFRGYLYIPVHACACLCIPVLYLCFICAYLCLPVQACASLCIPVHTCAYLCMPVHFTITPATYFLMSRVICSSSASRVTFLQRFEKGWKIQNSKKFGRTFGPVRFFAEPLKPRFGRPQSILMSPIFNSIICLHSIENCS